MPTEPPMLAETQGSPAEPPLNYEFLEGGDLTLRSCDNLDFSVHSLFLCVASPVLARMLVVTTPGNDGGAQQDVIMVEEAAEMVALMLKFIYPFPPPPISSFEQLGQALHVADKYQLRGMKTRLREQLSHQNSPVSISTHPLRALAVSLAHELHEEANTAISLAAQRYSFDKVDEMVKLAETIPASTPIIKLIGAASVRVQIIIDVLFSFHKDPMQLTGLNCEWPLCHSCFNAYYNAKRHSAPHWQARWAYAVFTEIKDRPVQEWDPFFRVRFFEALPFYGQMTTREIEFHNWCLCPERIRNSMILFEKWSENVLKHLKTRLQEADQIERLRLA